jgi:tetratricopeptide (TPR) repeat protein
VSVIADALKKAQRERMKRSSANAGTPMSTPFVVHMRAVRGPTFSWPRAVGFGAGAALLIAFVVFLVQLRKSATRTPLPAVPPPPTSERIVASATTSASQPASATIHHDSAASTSPPPAPTPSRDAMQPTTPAVLPRDRAAGSGNAAPTSQAGVARSLRIAVDQAGGGEYSHLFEQAVAAQRAGDTTTARALYERLTIASPQDADLLNNFGVLLTSTHENDRAIDMLQRAVAIAPGNGAAWANLGFVLREQGKRAESIAAFQRALQLDPSRTGVGVTLAQQYLATGSLTEARALLDRLLGDNPALAEAYYTRGQLSEMQGDRVAAIRDYTQFMRLASARLSPYAERVRAHVDSLSATSRPD